MTNRCLAEDKLLAQCTARLDSGGTPSGTAFFVAPSYAMTAAHVVQGTLDLPVVLINQQGAWTGHAEAIWPPRDPGWLKMPDPYPPPDVALVRIDAGPPHPCVRVATRRPPGGTVVIAQGHRRHIADHNAVAAETGSFTLTGALQTSDPDHAFAQARTRTGQRGHERRAGT